MRVGWWTMRRQSWQFRAEVCLRAEVATSFSAVFVDPARDAEV
jgi:hypothetical protein